MRCSVRGEGYRSGLRMAAEPWAMTPEYRVDYPQGQMEYEEDPLAPEERTGEDAGNVVTSPKQKPVSAETSGVPLDPTAIRTSGQTTDTPLRPGAAQDAPE